jgi:hypothetical protein
MDPDIRKKAWVISADMGYGHHRAVFPLRGLAESGIITVGKNDSATAGEKKLWSRLLSVYEFFSRARGVPFVGKPVFTILDYFMRIPSSYPIRNLSNRTFQVNLLASSIRKGLCSGMLEKISVSHLPVVTSFYASAVAADMHGYDKIYCIICDADINRIWVAKEPWESRISYFAPCGKAAQRLRAYGVPQERIYLSGFPLAVELLGGRDLPVLKSDLGQRLSYLDPRKRFWTLHGRNVEYFLGQEHCAFHNARKLTISYSVGGAGAQREIGEQIARSLRKKILSGEIRLNLIAGTKEAVRDYFLSVKEAVAPACENISVIWASTMDEYFSLFNAAMRETDIIWTKPSELSFYSGLGIPIIMTPTIGSQEKFNRRWLLEIQAGIRQENPEYTDQWLTDYLAKGRLAEAAWSGFLKARKLGTYKILDVLDKGKLSDDTSPLMR